MTLTNPVEIRTTATELRIASVPASHVYVRHLSPPAATADPLAAPTVRRLLDPSPGGGTLTPGQPWWPPAMLDPAWIEREHHTFDLMHLQFGFDALSPSRLQEVVDALAAHGKPLVHTVHDLRNPHHATRTLHDEQLDVLLPAADAIITLTPGAAAEIHRRWGRTATVLPHPHVVEGATMQRLARSRPAPARRIADRTTSDGSAPRAGEFRVGLHVKSLRTCLDPLAVLPVLVRAVRELPGAVLQVDGHTDVLDPGGARYDAELAAALAAASADAPDLVDLRVHDYFTDDELVDYLADLDLSVLPYRFGTHSGWLEACRDVGTPVAAPTCGYYADQGPVHAFTLDEDRFDEDSLVDAVRAAHLTTPVPAPTWDDRRDQRRRLAEAHAEIYARLVDGR